MNKSEIKQRIAGLNECMLADSTKELLLLTQSSDYTWNKAIAVIDREETKYKDWYSVDNKSCYRTWAEIEAFIDGLCIGKNTDFSRAERER